MSNTDKPSPPTFAFGPEHVDYVARYGGICRDCADERGVCPISALPCDNHRKAIKYVLDAIEYGVRNQFVTNPAEPRVGTQTGRHNHANSYCSEVMKEQQVHMILIDDPLFPPKEGDIAKKILDESSRPWITSTIKARMSSGNSSTQNIPKACTCPEDKSYVCDSCLGAGGRPVADKPLAPMLARLAAHLDALHGLGAVTLGTAEGVVHIYTHRPGLKIEIPEWAKLPDIEYKFTYIGKVRPL